ncbi:Carbohydrate sulfotransferase [Chondrus crispus]|uniref:Carbohydrate sulfotransferase n=1 Tax=Chondrus crispus TaxID=2769 RepID=R7QL39_CHOCR|nr:Carbohydrate sulfotransferase [Chondrus crispus]CDF38105.1 Carbohydrate sulfotransferase [Chondrus crispus]|eukprot:XP_005717974.1 Carbohydrate sulfotransferase [Chondrus crispus]
MPFPRAREPLKLRVQRGRTASRLLQAASLAGIALLLAVAPRGEDKPLAALLARPPPHIIVSEVARLVFCPVPKAASSNWKYLIRRWERVPDFANLSRAHRPATSGLRYLADYAPAEAEAILRDPTYFRFVFVREPYARLLSCYMDKFRNTDPEYVRAEYRTFLAALKGWTFARDVDVERDPRLTFAHFVQAVADMPVQDMNAHWMPQTAYCAIGVLPYDFVGRMENLKQDVDYVFRRLGRVGNRFPTQNQIGFPPSGASPTLADELYDNDLRAKVRAIYEPDFRILRYT